MSLLKFSTKMIGICSTDEAAREHGNIYTLYLYTIREGGTRWGGGMKPRVGLHVQGYDIFYRSAGNGEGWALMGDSRCISVVSFVYMLCGDACFDMYQIISRN